MKLAIHTRLSISFALIFTVLLILFSGVITFLMSSDLEQGLARDTEHDMNEILTHVFPGKTSAPQFSELPEESREFNILIKVLDEKGKIIFLSHGTSGQGWPADKNILDAALAKPVWSNEEIEEIPHLTLTMAHLSYGNVPYFVQIAKPKTDINRTESQLIFWINIGTPLILLITILMGRIFSRKALAPVEQIRRRAQTITSGDLHERLVYDGPQDELYRLTQTLNELLARIEFAFEQKKRFIADASHELRIPLTGMRGTLEVALRQDRTKEEYKQALETVHEETERLSELVWELLALARTDAGEMKLDKAAVDLSSFFQNLFEQAEALNANKQVVIRRGDLPQGTAWFDEVKVNQTLINLIENAINYNKPGGEVFLSAQLTSAALLISIKDTGIGISEEDQGKIFDRFYRVDKARSREAGGTGLGLAIALAIAQAHGGTLSVKSVLGEGSEFTLTLPRLEVPSK